VIDFSLPGDLVELKARVDRFIREAIVPLERDPRQGPHGPSEDFRRELIALGRAAGLLSPHAPVKWGGLGLDHRAMAVVFEAAGWSPLGPLALNIMAPDEGNTNLLDKIANDEQKERWLRPLVAGEIRTVFSMTEPDDGAGSDPNLMKTTARRHGDEFVISGRKWLITGAPGANINIVMARTLDEDGTDRGATMFLVDMDAPGFRIVRRSSSSITVPSRGTITSMPPSDSRKASGTWVCPTRQYGVENAARFVRAREVENMYSQSGSRGEPWARVNAPSTRVCGLPASQRRAAGVSCCADHSTARRAASLNKSVPISPMAAASWFPRTPRAPSRWSRCTTPTGSGPYPTTSPRCQTASNGDSASRMDSRAARFPWTSESSATRTASG